MVLANAYLVGDFTPILKQFTTLRAFFLHATWLVQTSVH